MDFQHCIARSVPLGATLPNRTSGRNKPFFEKNEESENRVKIVRVFIKNGLQFHCNPSINSVIPARFERATHSLEGCCSIQLSYGTGFSAPKVEFLFNFSKKRNP